MTGPGPNPYDLVPPTKLLAPQRRPTCAVCGRPQSMIGMFRSFGDRSHDSCLRTIEAWRKQIAVVRADPGVQAAQGVADEAQDAADRAQTAVDDVWETKVRALGLPAWYIDVEVATQRDHSCDC